MLVAGLVVIAITVIRQYQEGFVSHVVQVNSRYPEIRAAVYVQQDHLQQLQVCRAFHVMLGNIQLQEGYVQPVELVNHLSLEVRIAQIVLLVSTQIQEDFALLAQTAHLRVLVVGRALIVTTVTRRL